MLNIFSELCQEITANATDVNETNSSACEYWTFYRHTFIQFFKAVTSLVCEIMSMFQMMMYYIFVFWTQENYFLFLFLSLLSLQKVQDVSSAGGQLQRQ